MDDKIFQVKKDINRIVRCKDLNRMETYDLVRQKVENLSEVEIEILLKEYHRDYGSYDRYKELKDIISIFLTGIGLILTLIGIFFKEVEVSRIIYNQLLLFVGCYVLGSIALLSVIQTYRSQNMRWLQYVFDILGN